MSLAVKDRRSCALRLGLVARQRRPRTTMYRPSGVRKAESGGRPLIRSTHLRADTHRAVRFRPSALRPRLGTSPPQPLSRTRRPRAPTRLPGPDRTPRPARPPTPTRLGCSVFRAGPHRTRRGATRGTCGAPRTRPAAHPEWPRGARSRGRQRGPHGTRPRVPGGTPVRVRMDRAGRRGKPR